MTQSLTFLLYTIAMCVGTYILLLLTVFGLAKFIRWAWRSFICSMDQHLEVMRETSTPEVKPLVEETKKSKKAPKAAKPKGRKSPKPKGKK